MKAQGLKYPARSRAGYRRIVSPANARLRLTEFGVVSLSRGDSVGLKISGKEIAVTLTRGKCSVEGIGKKFVLGPRQSVFDEPPEAEALPLAGGVKAYAGDAMIEFRTDRYYVKLTARRDPAGQQTLLRDLAEAVAEAAAPPGLAPR